jgi:predicted benzoate:H+ symporter BenE
MITITDTITIANITIAFITITFITIAFIAIAISPGPNAHTYAHNRWEAGIRFRWKI